jgi:putative oxidoreductase
MNYWRKLLFTDNSRTTVLIRLIVGAVFLSEGIQKFLFPTTIGAGRFEKIGFDHPVFWSHFTATFEIVCGCLVLLGFLTRVAIIPLIAIMIVAFITTKYPILIDQGFWAMAHEFRTDFALMLGSLYLFINGGGYWSVDKLLNKK